MALIQGMENANETMSRFDRCANGGFLEMCGAVDRGQSPPWRHEFYYSHLFEHPAIPKSEGIRDERWKYIRYIESEPLYEELYDLRQDPLEERNLARAGGNDAQLKEMRERWKTWRAAMETWRPGTEWRDPVRNRP